MTSTLLCLQPFCNFAFLLLSLILMGCGISTRQQHRPTAPLEVRQENHHCILYCLRKDGFTGQGRIHLLKIDGKPVGELTGSNYYRIALHPGRYTVSVYLPPEIFLGQSKPALSQTKCIDLAASGTGRSFLLQYVDGMETGSLSFYPLMDQDPPLDDRVLAAAIDLGQTAQVRAWYKARYEGPARHGRPHGKGTLTWTDGCFYQGIFEYGHPTTKGRFYFPNGQYFRGNLRDGRPYRSGVLFTPEGEILFAGPFVAEKPHGSGIRIGKQGPETCRFENGNDVTQTIDQHAIEAFKAREPQKKVVLLETYRRQIADEHAKIIRQNSTWCQNYFKQGQRICQCTPFANDYLEWPDCLVR